MNALKNKIKSQRGASITFALLLFLVCAIISGVVVVAATAVGGRASKMAEMDQRYYAVNSAAELLRDVLESQTAVVTTGTKTVSTVDQDGNLTKKQKMENGNPVTDDDGNPVYEYEEDVDGNTVLDDDDNPVPVYNTSESDLSPELTVNGTTVDTTNDASLVGLAALKLCDATTENLPTTCQLTITNEGIDDGTKAAMAVNITPMLDTANKTLTLDVTNNDKSKGAYTLRLIFKANITQNENERTTYTAPLPTVGKDGKIIEGKYTRKKTVEKTKVSTIRWKMIDLQTVVAVATATAAPGGGGTP